MHTLTHTDRHTRVPSHIDTVPCASVLPLLPVRSPPTSSLRQSLCRLSWSLGYEMCAPPRRRVPDFLLILLGPLLLAVGRAAVESQGEETSRATVAATSIGGCWWQLVGRQVDGTRVVTQAKVKVEN